ncbi:phage holin family protein [uncultured Amnibacterium sp.]|uniref:phage holin family protein n=1 Tax=uncultured Amnibacterium sp. TaxID=1631851 RepID=UPI0035CC601A
MSRATTTEPDDKKSVFKLIGEIPGLITTLIRDEIAQLRSELVTRLKAAGIGIGLFAAAAIFLNFAAWVLIATAILGLANAVAPWLAALIIGVVLLVIAVILALVGLSRVKKGVPPVPESAIESVKSDVKAFKGTGNYDR